MLLCGFSLHKYPYFYWSAKCKYFYRSNIIPLQCTSGGLVSCFWTYRLHLLISTYQTYLIIRTEAARIDSSRRPTVSPERRGCSWAPALFRVCRDLQNVQNQTRLVHASSPSTFKDKSFCVCDTQKRFNSPCVCVSSGGPKSIGSFHTTFILVFTCA